MRGFGVLLLALALVVPLVPSAAAGPEPGLFCDRGEMVHDRLFPEPDQVNDFVGWEEGLCGLFTLEERHPDRMEIVEMAQSVGWVNATTQQRDTFPVYSVEITDETVPMSEKRGNLVFINSIHGNEKGAREGALRIIEDLLTDRGGGGEPDPAPPATGKTTEEVLKDLRLVFTFPNPDGWTHEMPAYRANDACFLSPTCTAGLTGPGDVGLETQGFVRVNGNGTDLNRQYPTTGLGHPSWPAMTEPEVAGQVDYFRSLEGPVIAGVDLHGMLNAENLTYLMIKDTQRELDEVLTHEAVARTTYKYLDEDPRLDPWRETVGPASVWGSTYDLLGYSAPGTGGGYIVQDVGLNAPGFTVELAFNHIGTDNNYPGGGQAMNVLHVAAMRDITLGFLDYAYHAPGAAVLEGEATIGYLAHPEGIAQARFDGTDADPNAVFDEMGRKGANIQELERLTPGTLEGLTHLVIPDTALAAYTDELAASGEGSLADPLHEIVHPWVEAGGTLVLTDSALWLAVELGLADDVRVIQDVTGKADRVDLDHALAAGTNAPVESFVDGNPLRYDPGTVPNHCLDGFTGETVGERVVTAATPAQDGETCTVLGEASLGDGMVRVMGIALPPPVGEGDHGVDGYALTPNGFRIFTNAMGLTLTEGPGEAQNAGGAGEEESETPGIGAVVLMGLVGMAALARRRRHR